MDAVRSTELPRRPVRMGRVLAHALGNVALGLAIGIACYYLATDMVARWRQGQLRSEVSELGVLAAPTPSAVLDEIAVDPFDFDGWETDDVGYWETLPEGGVFGRLVIEPMGLDTLVVKGHSRTVLKKGPGWIDYTDLPGPTGNVGISGHRTTYGAPFRSLDMVQVGDNIDLYSPYRRYRYEVSRVFTVTPDKVEVVSTTVEPQLTLTACHPPYSARLRLIVQANLVEVRAVSDTVSAP